MTKVESILAYKSDEAYSSINFKVCKFPKST